MFVFFEFKFFCWLGELLVVKFFSGNMVIGLRINEWIKMIVWINSLIDIYWIVSKFIDDVRKLSIVLWIFRLLGVKLMNLVIVMKFVKNK